VQLAKAGDNLNIDAAKPGFDYGFRLWDPAKRRQPAPPPKKTDDPDP
jgi:hypothetical protein